MKIKLIKANELEPDLVQAWSEIQRKNKIYASPFFRPEYVLAVNSVCSNIEVAIMEESDRPVGFFPFYRNTRNIAFPVGSPMSDLQGVVVRKNLSWNAIELIKASNLRAWKFDHLLKAQTQFYPYQHIYRESSYIDLSKGYEYYRKIKKDQKSKTLKNVERLTRKIERDVAPIRFKNNISDMRILDTLVHWKSEQCHLKHTPNVFSLGWPIDLMKRIMKEQKTKFSGILSALYAGDNIVAINVMMSSYDYGHGWFMAYDKDYSKFSPGLIMINEMAKSAQSLGIRLIDMGKGDEKWKSSFKTGTIPIAEGCIDIRVFMNSLWPAWFKIRRWVSSSPNMRMPALWACRLFAETKPRLIFSSNDRPQNMA